VTAPVARLDAVVLDCADAWALGRFYAELLGREVDPDSDDSWVQLSGETPALAFQRIARHRPPAWPHGAPQQAHLDLAVDDFTTAHRRVTALGATPLDPVEPPPAEGPRGFRVYADPAGHPFCLTRS
jgi:catechol 2,3-dioxygenase-like lactoylglutathione lyase family enzyme